MIHKKLFVQKLKNYKEVSAKINDIVPMAKAGTVEVISANVK
ncbi:hypothetical protein AAEX28_15810 [Lentisphaerota bacterium WC36G]